MCIHDLRLAYRFYLEGVDPRSEFVERVLGFDPAAGALSEDDNRNKHSIFARLSSPDCQSQIERLYSDAIKAMLGIPFDQCDDLLNALAFVQAVVAMALWKYDCRVSPVLESFASAFDRWTSLQSDRTCIN